MAERAVEICEIITYFTQGWCLQYFLGSFLEKRLSGRYKTSLLVSIAYGAMKMILGYLTPTGNDGLGGFYRLVWQSVFLAALTFCFYRAAKIVTAFLLTTFLAVSEISFFIGYMALSLSGPVFALQTRFFMMGYISADAFEGMLRITAAMLQILCCTVWVLLLFLSLKKVADSFREKEYDMQRTELLFILTPSSAGFLLCVLLRIIMVTVENGMPSLLYDRYPALRMLIPAILLLSLLSVLYSVKLFQDMVWLNREKSSRIVLEQQVDTLEEHVREVERIYGGLKSVKHDMKNTLSVLMRLSQTETSAATEDIESSEFSAYLSALYNSFEKLELRFSTGNAVADALLNMKYHDADRCFSEGDTTGKRSDCESGCSFTGGETGQPVKLDFDVEKLVFPADFTVQSYDLGVILGNALDNAMEACARLVKQNPAAKPFIRLSSFKRGKFFFLEIENSFDGKLKKGRQAEFPATMKADKHTHGIGFSNMKKTAEKYDGGVDFLVREDPDRPGQAVFSLTVMLK